MNEFIATDGGYTLDKQKKTFWKEYSTHLKSPAFWAELTKNVVITAASTLVTLQIAKHLNKDSTQGRK